MVALIPYLFLILAAGLAGVSMRFMLELKKQTVLYERQQYSVRRRRDEHLRIVEEHEARIVTMEGDIEKYQTELANLQNQLKEATVHLTALEEKEERAHPSERRIDMDGDE